MTTFEVVEKQENDFLCWNNWFDVTFKANLDQRWPTMKVALNLLNQMNRPVNIVETGCVRQRHDWGGGMSTLLFGEYVQRYGGKVVTIDNAPANIEICKVITKDYSHHIKYVLSDSLAELERMATEDGLKIDLLYLDSLDCPIDGSSAYPSQEHTAEEFRLAESMLHSKSIVLIDDSGFANGGKAGIVNLILGSWGWTCLMTHQQSLWLKL